MPELTNWLKTVVLGGAKTAYEERIDLSGLIIVRSGTEAEYHISKDNLLVQNDNCRMYSVFGEGRPLIFKIARDISRNSYMQTEVDSLKHLRQADTSDMYNWFFPELVETFVSHRQGNRRINVLGFPPVVENNSQMIPLSKILNEGRVDLKTVVWIYGKLLKVIGFTHLNNVANGAISASNVLVETHMHGVVLFDFTRAIVSPSFSEKNSEVKQATALALSLLKADQSTGKLPINLMDDPEIEIDRKQFGSLERFFQSVLKSGGDAKRTKDRFYAIVDDIWPARYHEFVLYPI